MIESIWPRPPTRHWWDRAAVRVKHFPGFCTVCSRPTAFVVGRKNLRESVHCRLCMSFNRHRQLVAVLLQRFGRDGIGAGLSRLPRDLRVWNLETKRALHDGLARHLGSNYTASEYLGPGMKSGEVRDGVMHVDVENTHFADDSFDLVISSDVLEHIPHLERAIKETHRVLRPGGAHVFTVPFHFDRFTTERRAVMDESGAVRHLMPPIYHGDPNRDGGALVFNLPGPEFLCDLESAGFGVTMYDVRDPMRGIIGASFVFVAQKR